MRFITPLRSVLLASSLACFACGSDADSGCEGASCASGGGSSSGGSSTGGALGSGGGDAAGSGGLATGGSSGAVLPTGKQPAAGGGEVTWPEHTIGLPTGSVKIVPLGDSITQGGAQNGEISYRYPLWQKLVDAGAHFDMVGSLTTGFNGDPSWPEYLGQAFDLDHEGHWGWTLDAVRDGLAGWLQDYTPDIALVLLGTNDAGSDTPENMASEAAEIFELLRADNPGVIIIWGQAFQEWEPFPEFRTKMAALAAQMTTAQSPILVVDHSPGWLSNPDSGGSHTLDWVHTSPAGDEKLAANWMSALAPLLGVQ